MPDDSLFETAREAYRDATLFEFILATLPMEARSTLASTIKVALKDAVAPNASSQNTKGRDAQVELFVAAACTHAGLGAVRLIDPPDVRCEFEGKFFGLAVKRVKSADTLIDNIADGAEQVHRSPWPGSVFVDVSVAFNRRNDAVLAPFEDEHFRTVHAEALQRAIRERDSAIRDAVSGTRVRSVLIQDHQIRQVHGEGWRLEPCLMHMHMGGKGSPARRESERFERAFRHAFPS